MKIFLTIAFVWLLSCRQDEHSSATAELPKDTIVTIEEKPEPLFAEEATAINTGDVTPAQLTGFAQTLIGIPYQYGSIDPAKGFDCSGFITYVFNHFHIAVPRSSVGFTNVDHPIHLSQAKPGDIILFTGTDSSIRTVGHMGIITSSGMDSTYFIHSTSGRAYGVTISTLNKYYMRRFVKVIRVFKQNDE